MDVGAAVFDWRCRRAVRLLGLQRRRTLQAELASCTSSDRQDLFALLDCYDDDQTADLRDLLGRQMTSWRPGRQVAGLASAG